MEERSQQALFGEHGPVEELEFTEEFLEHLRERATYAKHNVRQSEILEAHAGKPRYFENRSEGRAPVILVGLTDSRRMIVVPVEPAGRFGIWRPVTAFEANRHDRERYQAGEGSDDN